MAIISELLNDAKFILNYRKRTLRTQKALNAHAPRAGDLAPDFTLTDSRATESVTLSDLRGKKPVALVFGSYT
jgi:peroxiredoxin